MTLKNVTVAALLLLGAGLPLAPAQAQTAGTTAPPANQDRPLTAADLEALRAEIRSERKQVTASTLQLTDAEATRFWPVYDRYAAERTAIKDDYYALIVEYANKFGKFDDKIASDFIRRWVDVDTRSAALRAKYVPIVEGVLPGIKAASFFQIDRRLSMLIDLKIASMMPIMQAQVVK